MKTAKSTSVTSAKKVNFRFLTIKLYLLFSLLFLNLTIASAQCPPTAASFSLNPASGTSIPHAVFFTDNSTLPDTWAWDFGDLNTSTAQNPIHAYTSFGVFTVRLIVTDTIFGCSDTAFSQVSVCALTASITSQTNVTCNGGSDGSLTVMQNSGSPNYTYSWSNASVTSNTASSTNSISGLSAGTYTVTITDNTGCTATASATITQPSAPLSSALNPSNILCFGNSTGSIINSVSGGTSPYTHLWNDAATSTNRNNLAAGTYTVTVTDNNGCTTTASTTITQRPDLVVSLSPINISCNGGNNGAITANVSGGTTAYTYNWSNAATTSSISNLTAATYTVTVTDAFGCTEVASTTLTQPSALIASVSASTNVSCNGLSDGSATASASGGTTPYTYTWSNAVTTVTNSNLGAGIYTVTITDANGCTDTDQTTITEPTALVVSSVVDSNATGPGVPNGGATASASGGTSPYTYTWSNAATTASITGVNAGTYTVTVTDNNGCTGTSSSTITEPSNITFTLSFVQPMGLQTELQM